MNQELEQTEEDLGPSKSQRKRNMVELQKMGEALMAMKPAAWTRFSFQPRLHEALHESLRIKKPNARRRHVRFLAKLLDREDTDAVQAAIDRLEERKRGDRQRLHLQEGWRERLIDAGDEALGAFLAVYPQADRQRLRQLIRDARKERDGDKPPAAARKLFRLIRELDQG